MAPALVLCILGPLVLASRAAAADVNGTDANGTEANSTGANGIGAKATAYQCAVPAGSSPHYLLRISAANCEMVRRSSADFARALLAGEDRHFGSSTQGTAWLSHLAEATASCSLAAQLLDAAQDPNATAGGSSATALREAARRAINAWGSVVMRGRSAVPTCPPHSAWTSSWERLPPYFDNSE